MALANGARGSIVRPKGSYIDAKGVEHLNGHGTLIMVTPNTRDNRRGKGMFHQLVDALRLVATLVPGSEVQHGTTVHYLPPPCHATP
jgi:hypothetical protein